MHRSLVLFVLAFVPAGCERASSTNSRNSAPPERDALQVAPGWVALDQLDARTPVPLLPQMAAHQKQNMRDHLLAVQKIVGAVASGDFASVERAATEIGYSESMAGMCRHMGAGAPGFTERALAFHHAADGIAAAARELRTDRVLSELAKTLQVCTSCHATYKQSVVDARRWQEITAE